MGTAMNLSTPLSTTAGSKSGKSPGLSFSPTHCSSFRACNSIWCEVRGVSRLRLPAAASPGLCWPGCWSAWLAGVPWSSWLAGRAGGAACSLTTDKHSPSPGLSRWPGWWFCTDLSPAGPHWPTWGLTRGSPHCWGEGGEGEDGGGGEGGGTHCRSGTPPHCPAGRNS